MGKKSKGDKRNDKEFKETKEEDGDTGKSKGETLAQSDAKEEEMSSTGKVPVRDGFNIDAVKEQIQITLDALRQSLKESLQRVSLVSSLGITPVDSNILEKSGAVLQVTDKFHCFYKLLPIGDNARFILVPIPFDGFEVAQTPLEIIQSINQAIRVVAKEALKIVKGVSLVPQNTYMVPADGSYGLDTSMADAVISPLNNRWRDVLSHSTYAVRNGTRVTLGAVMPEWFYHIFITYSRNMLQSVSNITNSPRYHAAVGQYRSFAYRRALIPRYSDPQLPEIAALVQYQAPIEDLPLLIQNFPMSNFISVYGCMATLPVLRIGNIYYIFVIFGKQNKITQNSEWICSKDIHIQTPRV